MDKLASAGRIGSAGDERTRTFHRPDVREGPTGEGEAQDIRDDLFVWIGARIDHWGRWGEVADNKGADAFTQHLLGSVVASRTAEFL